MRGPETGSAAAVGVPATRNRSRRRHAWWRRTRRFRPDSSGAVSVEFVIWMPLVLGLLGLIFDASITIFETNRMWDVARDTARRVAIRDMKPVDAQSYAEGMLPGAINGSYVVSVSHSGSEDVTVDVRLTGAAIRFFGMLPIFPLSDIRAVYTMRAET